MIEVVKAPARAQLYWILALHKVRNSRKNPHFYPKKFNTHSSTFRYQGSDTVAELAGWIRRSVVATEQDQFLP